MKGLKKVALASAIAAVSAGAQAELKALDDSAMGELTGQAGLTIDIETKWSIGEFMYKDAGSVLISGISMGGNDSGTNNTNSAGQVNSSYLDNIRLTLDIAGADAAENAGLNYGFSEIGRLSAFLAGASNPNTEFGLNATAVLDADTLTVAVDYGTTAAPDDMGADMGVGQWGTTLAAITDATNLTVSGSAAQGTENGSDTAGVEDGDLVIHWGFTDAFQDVGGFQAVAAGAGNYNGTTVSLNNITWEQGRDAATRAVDFNFNIDSISLADSTYVAGDLYDGTTTAQTTTLISGLDMKGYLGPADLHIENDGNGFGADGTENALLVGGGAAAAGTTGNADSKITWGSYFNVTELDVYIDIAGISLEGVKINNSRGDLTGLDGTSAFGFAHSRRTIYAVSNTVIALGETATNYKSGLALNTEFKGDIDIEALRFGGIGNGESIGSIYLTDIESDTRWTISAH